MTYTYTIFAIPPSNNQFIGRNVRWQYQSEKKRWAELIAVFCRPKPPKPIECARVTISYTFKDGRRRDPDNYSGKMILDGLVNAGILADDSFDCIDLTLKKCGYDKNDYRTEIVIQEV